MKLDILIMVIGTVFEPCSRNPQSSLQIIIHTTFFVPFVFYSKH